MEIAISKRHVKKIRSALAIALILLLPVVASVTQQWLVNRKTRSTQVASGASLVTVTVAATGSNDAARARADDSFTRLTFDTLKSWNYVEGKTPIPDFIKALDGKNVEMIGFMMPLTQVENITEFLLVPSLWGCCYGQPPAINHIVVVKLPKGHTSKFYNDVISVRGKFAVSETREDNELVSLYTLTASSISGR